MLSSLTSLGNPAIWLALAFGTALGAAAASLYAIRASRRLAKRLVAECAACEVRLSHEAAEHNQALNRRLTEQENKLRTVIRSAPACIMLHAMDGTILEMNPAGMEMVGAETPDQVVGTSVYSFICPDYHARYTALTQRVLRGEEGKFEFEVIGHCQQRRRVETHAVPLRDSDGTIIALLGITLDITEQHRIADQFRENEARLRAIIESEPECVKLEAPDGTLLDMNPAGLAILEVKDRDHVVGKSIYRVIAPDHHAAYRAHAEAVFRGEKRTLEFQMVTSKGNWRWLETHAVPMRDNSGGVVALLGITRDVTARKQAEEKLLQRQIELAHVCRLANLGEMASGLAHELNQPLCAISTYAEAVSRTLKAGRSVPETACEQLQHISAQADRAGMIIRRLRDMVAKKPIQTQTVSVNHLIRDAIELLQPELTAKSVLVRCELPDALPLALADSIHVEQVVLNLARNAAEAMSQNPAPRELLIRTRVDGDGCIEVAVQDSGPGVSEAVIEQVFAPFFTTKENGIGMGLSISRSIIEAHMGRIWVKNNASVGACFSFTLPASVNARKNNGKIRLQDQRQGAPEKSRHNHASRRAGAAAARVNS
jgi:PAS domain S-box-containing protein